MSSKFLRSWPAHYEATDDRPGFGTESPTKARQITACYLARTFVIGRAKQRNVQPARPKPKAFPCPARHNIHYVSSAEAGALTRSAGGGGRYVRDADNGECSMNAIQTRPQGHSLAVHFLTGVIDAVTALHIPILALLVLSSIQSEL